MSPAVSFDLWHTLLELSREDEDRYIAEQEGRLAELLAASPRSDEPTGTEEPLAAARAALNAAARRVGVGGPVGDVARDAARRAGRVPRPDDWVREVEAAVDRLRFEAVPGGVEQLAGLRDRGVRVAVVSNLVGETGRSMRKVVDRLGFGRYVEAWASSDELPWAKPAPEIFWKALEPLGIPASEAVHVGDLASDVLGARAAGFRGAVLFRGARAYGRRYSRRFRTEEVIDPPPDRVIDTWRELPEALAGLFVAPPVGETSPGPNRRRTPRRSP